MKTHRNFHRLLVQVVCLTLAIQLAFGATNCNRRNYADSFICVCSTASCDTIPPIQQQPPGVYQKFTSDRNEHRFTPTTGQFEPGIRTSLFNTVITVQRTAKLQKMLGFGGAFTDAAGSNILALSSDLQDTLLRAYFGSDGLEYNFGRVPIGGTDFSTHGYSYDDNAENDVSLESFALQEEDYKLKIPLIQRAMEMNDKLRLIASAWTAPKWMKTNGQLTGGAIKKEYFQLWADYFVKFFAEYQKAGVDFWGVTTGNEPSLALVNSDINTVGWSPGDMRTWIGQNFGPTIRNSPFRDLKILGLDDQRFFLPWYPKFVFRNGAENYIEGIAVHWYWDKLIPPITLDWTHKAFPDLFILNTEACRGDKSWEQSVILGSWERAEDYAYGMLVDFDHSVSGFIDWNLALDTDGGPTYIKNNVDSPIIVNATAQEFYKQPMFYAIGHFAKFIPIGSHKLSHFTNIVGLLDIGVFERANDAGIVLVLHNRDNKVIKATVNDPQRGHIDLELSAKSINTIIYW